MDLQALADKLEHPPLELYKDIAPHGRFIGIDDGVAYHVSIWCHTKFENIFYYTSTGFDESTDLLSIFIIVDNIVKFRHAKYNGAGNNQFSEDKEEDALNMPILEALQKSRLTYLFDQKLEE